MNRRQLRWRGAVAAAIVLAAAGIADQNGTLLLAAALPLAYVAYGSLSRTVVPDALTAERTVEPSPARPGAVVRVTLTVTNGSDRTITDLRVADGVPEDIAVVEGTPRTAGTLRPDESVETAYHVVAKRGDHPFERPQVRTRGIAAGAVATARPDVSGDETLVCRLDADAPPLEEHGEGRVGTLNTDDPGEGLTFHSVREYHPDDPAARIDWRHYAKRGELATVNYERNVPATVVLVLDARRVNHVVASEGRPTAVELQAYAATRTLTDLLRAGNDVGVAVLGRDGPQRSGVHWLPPGSGAGQRERALDLFRIAAERPPDPVDLDGVVEDGRSTDPADGPGRGATGERSTEPDDDRTPGTVADQDPGDTGDRTPGVAAGPGLAGFDAQVRQVLELAPAGAQLTVFSPLLDDAAVSAIETWRGAEMPVVLLSVDVVPETTVSGQFAEVRRRTRLARCQGAGARVFDWQRGTPLPLVIQRAFAADAKVSAERSAGGVR